MKVLVPSMGVAATLALLSPSTQAAIIGVEVPSRTGYNNCAIADSIGNPLGQISLSAPPYPLDTSWGSGIGFILNPNDASGPGFALHAGPGTVTFQFDRPTTVEQLEIIQHANGVSRVEGFVGNDLGSLVSIGNIFGPKGDVVATDPPWAFADYESYVFAFPNPAAGTYFQFQVTKTSNPGGWALYRAYPRTADGTRIELATEPVPEPGAYGLIAGLGLAAFGIYRRMRA